jgi:hypothetical protein
MSYCICGLGVDRSVRDAFQETLTDIAPSGIQRAAVCLESGGAWLSSFGNAKTIQDSAIRSEVDGSWLALVGTPLIRWDSNAEALAFLAEFCRQPARVLREGIDGNFVLFAYDAPRKKLLVASDFNNTIPIYYAKTAGGTVFCSHEVALARLVRAGVDPDGFSQATHLGLTWGSHTRFSGIQRMLPCQLCVVGDDGQVHAESYWRPQEETPLSGGLDEQMEKWLALLKQAVGAYYDCAGRKPVITDFTAGEDGRLLVAQCHALGIPFRAHVTGLAGDTDVVVATEAARVAGFELIVRQKHQVTAAQLLTDAPRICLRNDGYQDFFKSCTEFATELGSPLDDYGTVKYCGLPGGEAFRGSYYLRGKAFFPTRKTRLDESFFTKLKFLLDYEPGLLKYPDAQFLQGASDMVKVSLAEVQDFPVGTQIDHVLRVFQTCLLGLKYKNPLYLPFATKPLTKSIYWLSPRYKKGGRLTKACTERLFPELAVVRTQNGVPTIRKTLWRLPMFLPEYAALAKKIGSGAVSRLFKWTKPNKWYYSDEWTSHIFTTLLNERPYCQWFSAPETMATGHLYQAAALGAILREAKTGTSRQVPILSRIINNEMAYRWVSRA